MRGLDPVHAGHLDVHEDQVETLAGRRNALNTVVGGGHPRAQGLQHAGSDQTIGGVVLDQQDAQAGEQGAVGLVILRDRLGAGLRLDLQPEGRAFAQLTLEADLAAHHVGQAPADGQAQARAAEPAGGRAVALPEALEQLPARLLADTDAGVVDLETQAELVIDPLAREPCDNAALQGELHGIAQQVEQGLAQAQRIGRGPSQVCGRLDAQTQTFRVGLRAKHVDDAAQQLGRIHRLGRQLQLASLDLREVDDVVQQLRQHLAAAQGLVQQTSAVVCQLLGLQEMQHAQHPVHRRADLVAHVGEELALGLGGAERGVAGGDQFGDVLTDANDVVGVGAGPAHPAPGAVHVSPFLGRRVLVAIVDLDVFAGAQGLGEGVPDTPAILDVDRQGHLGDGHGPHAALRRAGRGNVLVKDVDALARIEAPDIDAGGAAHQLIGALGLLADDLSGAVLAEVLEDDQQPAAFQHFGLRAHPQPAAALAGQAMFGTGVADRAQGVGDDLEHLGVVKVEEVADRAAQGVLGRPAGQVGPGGIDADDRVILQNDEHVEAALEEPVSCRSFDSGGSLGIQVLAHPVFLVFNRYRRIG